MTTEQNNNGLGSRVLWAALSPLILFAAALSVAGIILIPALCVYLDNRSKTYTAAISLVILAFGFSFLQGAVAAGFSSFIVIATAAAYLCVKLKAPFKSSLVISAAGGVLGFLSALAVINFSLPTPINIAAADSFLNWAKQWPEGILMSPLDFVVLYMQMTKDSADLFKSYFDMAAKLPSMANADKIALVRADIESAITLFIPPFALVVGSVTGALGYYLGRLAVSFHEKKSKPDAAALPPFATFRIPKYVVISLLLLQLLSMFGLAAEWEFAATLNVAAYWVLNMLMVAQALALASFYLNRKRVSVPLQALILIPTVLIFSGIMVWVGLIDVLFNMRAFSAKVDFIKNGGKQVFTRDSLGRINTKDKKDKTDKPDKKDDGEDAKK